jgi:undecaprenyl-diphosphatase
VTPLEAILIAVIEGITEFLPISSTAHMHIANAVLGITPDPFVEMFEVVIQLAAILSVVTIYYKKFLDVRNVAFYGKLVLAVIPVLIAGYFLKRHIDAALDNLYFIASVMIAGGIALVVVDRFFDGSGIDDERQITKRTALTIGSFQVLSVLFPGLSRSAATIIGGMSQKLSRRLAAEFSFFLAVPTMCAASAKSFLDVYQDHRSVLVASNFALLALGAVVAYIVALLSVKFLIGYLGRNGFKAFGYYRIIAGSLVIIVLMLQRH